MIFNILVILNSISLTASIIAFVAFAVKFLKVKNEKDTTNFVKTNLKGNILGFGITTVFWTCILTSLLLFQDSIREFVINHF
ncbi:hypothetical protein bcgnr5390_10100 [Bacillus luti]|nr:hypothetical protein BC2903_30810 [Bacillus cereus]